ncbi:MAG: AraC family transcriptional regulator [Dysgonomonas sp.]
MKKLNQLTFENFASSSSYIIENFIASDSENSSTNISFEHPFSFDGIVLAICLKGTGHMKINFKEYVITENSIITMLPNQIVEAGDHTDDFFIELLAFSFDYLADLPVLKDFNLPQKIATNPVLNSSKEDTKNIFRYYSFIIETFNNRRHGYLKQVIKGLLYSLTTELTVLYLEKDTQFVNNSSSRSQEIADQFLLLLKDNFKAERSASFYADKLCITTKYLSETLKKVTGRSVNVWLEDAITLGAKMLLKSTNLTVLQISEELSFPNPSYFGRFFKKQVGMTPKEYRDS